jgi:hypothetical protein
MKHMTIKGLITNDWDRDNLNFLLNSPPEVLKEWEAAMEPDDLAYAQELLDAYAEELRVEATFLKTEAELSLLCEYNTAKTLLDAIAKK